MKYFSLLILIIFLWSCSPKKKKPFIITKKRPSNDYLFEDGSKTTKYYYEDSMGTVECFYDRDIYHVGDTL